MEGGGWQPRGGAKLPTGWELPGPIQRAIHSLLDKFPKTLLHPVWGIMVATLITITGRSELILHSYGLTLAVGWLAVDLWAWLLGKRGRWQWRFAVGGALTAGMFVAAMGIMWWWMDGMLMNIRKDVDEKLEITALLPPGETDPVPSLFTVTNNSSVAINSYEISCVINKIIYGHVVIRGHPPDDETFSQPAKSSRFPLRAGGGSDSASCLDKYIVGYDFKCADVTIKVTYNVDIDDTGKQTIKKARFVTGANGGKFQWVNKNPEDTQTYCLVLGPMTLPKQP